MAINGHGWIAGWSAAADGSRHAILWDGSTLHDLGEGLASGLNDGGIVVGTILFGNVSHAAVFHGGMVVGTILVGNVSHAAVVHDGSVADLGTLGGDMSFARAINNHGRIVGSA